ALAFPAIGLIGVLASGQAASPAASPPISFAKDIQPILENNCLSCHGDTAQMGKFDLRSRERALRGGARGSDIVPGRAAESGLYRRIAGLEQPSMPVQGAALTPDQIAAIKGWIDQG